MVVLSWKWLWGLIYVIYKYSITQEVANYLGFCFCSTFGVKHQFYFILLPGSIYQNKDFLYQRFTLHYVHAWYNYKTFRCILRKQFWFCSYLKIHTLKYSKVLLFSIFVPNLMLLWNNQLFQYLKLNLVLTDHFI